MTDVAVGMVGAGAVATRHVRTLLAMDGVRVAAVADPAIERARRLAPPPAGSASGYRPGRVAQQMAAEGRVRLGEVAHDDVPADASSASSPGNSSSRIPAPLGSRRG